MTNRSILLLCSLFVWAASCTPTRKVAYLDEIKDGSFRPAVEVTEAPFSSNDILSITISSLDAEASAIFNNNTSMVRSTTSTGSNTQLSGYLVDPAGFIQLPVLGRIKAAGVTKTQLKNTITQLILSKRLLVEPLVEIRHLNFEVTVLGEVARPTVITVPSEKISLVQALGLAGDLTIYGKRENVLLIREEANQRITRRLDLNSPNFIRSPYYFLQPGDVVYVQPNKAKVASASQLTQYIPAIITGISALIIVLDRIIK